MFELDSTRHNPLVDPQLHVWGWEIPVYLFFGGLVAGMMILGGWALLRSARAGNAERLAALQAPLLGFVLINLGMGALFLDLAHKLYVWRVYLTFQLASPMSWGSWVLILVYAALLLWALALMPRAWPQAAARVPALRGAADALRARPAAVQAIGGLNIVLGIGLGLYTGILLNTMVARPLWNSALLAPLFLVSGLSAGAATLHLAGGRRTEPAVGRDLMRADLVFLALELLLIALLIGHLLAASASHAAAAGLLLGGPYTMVFWGGVVGAGLLLPMALQALQLSHRMAHSMLPALLVLAGGFLLRWVMVNAGQASALVSGAAH
jgi:formate-dependent nitrite reductase membrane component NrfD